MMNFLPVSFRKQLGTRLEQWPLTLFLLISAVYAPFLGFRLLRTAGDEKVYVSQAIEMARAGNWFVQTLQDVPDYYKGPLHYLLLRLGMGLFNWNPWATLYMNYLFVLLGAFALAAILRRRLPEWREGPLWIGAAFSLGLGLYSHAFVSQMEVQLAALFAGAFFLLDRLQPGRAGFAFWTVAGLIGWSKSPLHSVFIGTSALLYWTLTGEILQRLKTPATWLGALWGVTVCIAGYLPPLIFDRQNFLQFYYYRETLSKGSNGQNWPVSIVSTFGFYQIPWLFTALVAYVQGLLRGPRLARDPRLGRLLALGVAGFTPSVAFFLYHPYHFENYNLPVIGAILLMIGTFWGSLTLYPEKIWSRLYRAAAFLNAGLLLTLPILLTVLVTHFSPMPEWWPNWLLLLAWLMAALTLYGVWRSRGERPGLQALAFAASFVTVGAFFATLGEREMRDLRAFLAEARARGENPELVYYNVNRNIWSEWGYLNFWLKHRVTGAHTPEALRQAIRTGAIILVPAKRGELEGFQKILVEEFPQAKIRSFPWKRWRTQGIGPSGQPLWKDAWEQQDLSLLETDYQITQVLLAD